MVDALVSTVLEQFISYAQQEVKSVAGVREEVDKLSLTLRMIQGVLEDAEQKQVKDIAVKVWLEELKNVLYDANDVMDEWNTKESCESIKKDAVGDNALRRRKVSSFLLSPFSCFKHVTVSYDISHQIKKIREKLDEIAIRKNQLGLTISSSHSQARRVTSSLIDVSKVFGRDADKEKIVNRLLGGSSHQEMGVHVVAIVGMGGFGKTTIAKLVLKEESVSRCFEKKMWVCVSEPFDLIGVAKAIIEEAKGDIPMSREWEPMHQGLSKALTGIRFLLVLDDVWTKDSEHWNQLKLSLDGGAPGSRILVTTRNNEVAHMMGSSYIHKLEKLSENDSWSLLGDIAFNGREQERGKYEKIGKMIAMKCKGVPLALSTLGALLCERRTVQSWRDILASDIWELAHMKEYFLPSLFLSYYSLPSISKQCFLYCAVFPKDTVMEKAILVKLWMAEGFLGSENMGELERIGEDHFHNLAVRSFYQDFEKDSNGNITSCKMHDLVRDFAEYLSQGECSNGTQLDYDKVRYMHLEEIVDSSVYKARMVRTLLSHKRISSEYFRRFLCLRVLDLQWSKLEKLPEAVENLVHLRYLDLSYGRMLLELPETICSLYNLQTLRLNWCEKLQKLPEEIGTLSNLRHLEIEGTDSLHRLPQSIKRLSSLRTLSKFIVCQRCKIGDLKHLNNLCGAIEMMGLSGITNESDAIEADLKGRKALWSLTFDWGFFEGEPVPFNVIGVENIFEKLEPHEEVEELKIRNFRGSQFPCWFGNSLVLGNIVKIELNDCHQCTQLPALGQLASLENLEILGMHSVNAIGNELYGLDSCFGTVIIAFPKLKKLSLWRMGGLKSWELPITKDTKMMPSLHDLRIGYCPKLKAIPCIGKLESLERLELCRLDSVKRLDLGIMDDGVSDDQSVQQEELKIFVMLQELEITCWDLLDRSFYGDGWRSILGHVPKISIDGEEITNRS